MKKYCFLILFLFLYFPLEGKRIVLLEKPEQGAKYLVAPASVVSFTGKVCVKEHNIIILYTSGIIQKRVLRIN